MKSFSLRVCVCVCCAADTTVVLTFVWIAGLSEMQKTLYKNILTKNIRALGAAATGRSLVTAVEVTHTVEVTHSTTRQTLFAWVYIFASQVNVISSLRKVCNHPYLFQGMEPEPFTEGVLLWWGWCEGVCVCVVCTDRQNE